VPKATNEFQDLVELMTRLAGDDANVEASRMLVDLVSGKPREVDIVIEKQTYGYTTLIGIECRAGGETADPQDVTFVDEMHGKHLRLPTNLLVLVAQKGFSAPAIEKAESLGHVAISPTDITEDFVGRIVNKAESLRVMEATFVDIQELTLWVEVDQGVVPFNVEPHVLMSRPDGTPLGTAKEFLEATLRSTPPEQLGIRDATGDEKSYTIEFGEVDADRAFMLIDGQPVCMSVETDDGSGPLGLPVKAGRFGGTFAARASDLPLAHSSFNGAHYSAGVADLGDGKLQMVFTEAADGTPPRGAVKFTPAKPEVTKAPDEAQT
jgi:hypothetical protein